MDYASYRLFANKTHWITAIAAVLLVFGVSIGLAVEPDGSDLAVQVVWPERLSYSTDADVVVVIRQPDPGDGHLIPAPGARVTLFQLDRPTGDYRSSDELIYDAETLREVSSMEVDAAGQGFLRLPHLMRVDGAGQVGAGQVVERKDLSTELALRVEHDGEVEWLSRGYGRPPAASMAMSADRPLYQPGQTIKLRLMAVDPDTGRPVGGQVRWEIRDPRSNLVFRREGALSAAGIGSTEMRLSPDCTQGVYQITAWRESDTVTKTVDVQPFRLPRYKVTVAPKEARLAPDGQLEGAVEARYTYGDPVVGAGVDLVIGFRRGGVPGEEHVEGKTGEDGRLPFSFKLPQVDPGSVTLTSIVTSDTGRAERGAAAVSIIWQEPTVELLAAGLGSQWLVGRVNEGFVVVSDGLGKPVSGATVDLWVPEQREERQITVKTDQAGRASFAWTPIYEQRQVRLTLTLPDGQVYKRRMEMNVQGAIPVLEPKKTRVSVGEPLEFTLRHVSGDLTVVAFNRRYPISAARLQRGQGDTVEGSITFDDRARGLTVLTVLDANGYGVTSLPIWVVQSGGDAVEMKLDQEEHRPGDKATLGLGFPASTEASGKAPQGVAPVAFGLVGVDEALYALKERSELPLSILLRHDPELIGAASTAMTSTSGPGSGQDPVGQRIEVARFVGSMRSQLNGSSALQFNFYPGSTHSKQLKRLARVPWGVGWATLLGAAALLLGYVAIRATWRPLAKRDFSVGRVFAFLGITAAALVVGGVAAGISPQFFAGALTVWLVVLICWLIAAAVRQPQLPLSLWLWCVLGMILLVTGLGITLAGVTTGSHPPEGYRVGVAVALVTLLALLVVEVFLWAMMALTRRLYKTGLGLATLFGMPLALLAGAVLSVGGRSYESAPAFAPSMQMAKTADFESAGGEGFMAGDKAREEKEADGEAPPEPEPSSGAEPAKPGGGSGPRVRSLFPETMVWVPELASDEAGRATARFDVPDSITTWRLNVMANTWDGRFGEGQAGMRVIQPFFVELDLPTHLTQDDLIEVPVTLVNNADTPVEVQLSASTEGGLRVLDPLPEAASLTPRERRLLTAFVVAERPGAATMTVTARIGDAGGDAVRVPVQIAPDGRELSRTRSGIVNKGWQGDLKVADEAIAGTPTSNLKLYPSVVADALDGLDGMLRMPTGCFEQTSSANYPNVMVLSVLGKTDKAAWPGGPDKWTEAHEAATEFLELGYQRMLSFQRYDGGFALYPDATESDIMLTAYGLMQLSAMAKVMFIDEQVLRRALQYLISTQNEKGSWPIYAGRVSGGDWRTMGDPGQVRSTAFVTWSILSSPFAEQYRYSTDKALDHLEKNLEALDAPDALAYAANALLLGGRKEAGGRAITRLTGMAKREGDVVYWGARYYTWMGGYGLYADIETTAIATHALLEAQAEPELLSGALRWLASRRSPWGGWGSTQATVWALRTMDRLRSIGDKPATLTIKMDGALLAELNPTGDAQKGSLRITPGDLLMHVFYPEATGPGQHTFSIETSNPTAAMTQATVRFAVPWTSPLASVEGERFKVAVNPDTRALRRGAELNVQVTVTNPVADQVGATIVELPRPPGAFVDPEQFEAMQANGAIDRFEILPTHVRLYLSTIEPERSRTLRYTMRPLLRGTLRLPVARAYAFYAPDPITERPGGIIKVE